MVKWAIASIPAILIIILVSLFGGGLVAAIFN
jgi:hypothetical protein